MQVLHYLTDRGVDPFQTWVDRLRDLKARAAILRRIDRLAIGNPGDCKIVREGIRELRIDHGPGYRAYFAIEERTVILLLCGGSKGRQDADIDRAARYLQDFRQRR